MADTTLFELVSPEKLVMSKNVSMVVVPGAEGFFGVLPRHIWAGWVGSWVIDDDR